MWQQISGNLNLVSYCPISLSVHRQRVLHKILKKAPLSIEMKSYLFIPKADTPGGFSLRKAIQNGTAALSDFVKQGDDRVQVLAHICTLKSTCVEGDSQGQLLQTHTTGLPMRTTCWEGIPPRQILGIRKQGCSTNWCEVGRARKHRAATSQRGQKSMLSHAALTMEFVGLTAKWIRRIPSLGNLKHFTVLTSDL